MRPVHWIVTAPAAVVAALFAVSNREHVSVGLWPLPDVLDAPLYLVVLAALVVGFLFGEFVAWLGAGQTRRLARERMRRIAALERELNAAQSTLAQQPPQPQRPTPAALVPANERR
ncbi:MAG TPA: LapA family protein [Stellaceae bacterium]|nr:LapA family protein [Stellaceae bacterium]